MIPNYTGCEKCPLRDQSPVYGSGPEHARIIILGEAPGSNEVIKKTPFVGKSGQLLRQTLKTLGLDPSEIWFTNACLCHPEGNKTPSITAIKCCNARLIEEVRRVHPDKILAVGGSALTALRSPEKNLPISKNRGMGIRYTYDISVNEVDQDVEISAYLLSTYHPAAIIRDSDLFRDFTQDIQKFIREDHPLPPPEIQCIIPETAEEALDYLDQLSGASQLSCDLETTGFSPMNDVILSIGIGALAPDNSGVSLLIPNGLGILEDPRVNHALWTLFNEYPGPFAYHNIKFDVQFLHQDYFGKPIIFKDPWDTMLMQYAQDERGNGAEGDTGSGRGYRVHGLKDQARMRYDIPDYHFGFEDFLDDPGIQRWIQSIRDHQGSTLPWEDPDTFEDSRELRNALLTYQGMDCYVTLRLLNDLYSELYEESPKLLDLVHDHLVPGALFLSRLELTGAPMDREYLLKTKSEMEIECTELKEELDRAAVPLGFVDANYQSYTQVQKFLGALGVEVSSTEREVLLLELQRKRGGKNVYSDDVIHLGHVLADYRQKARTLSKDIIGLIDRIDPDGRIRPDYLLHGSRTGRLACRDPNLQNVPVLMGPVVRFGIAISDPNYLLVEADESQLELRVAAWISQDEAMIQSFRNGEDIHRKVASDMFHKPPEEITKHERYLAKYVDFGVVYGRGAKSLTEGWEAQYIVDNLGGRAWTLREAEKFIDDFLSGVPGLRKWIENQHKFVRINHYVETPMGRRRRFPLITGSEGPSIERESVNTPIQSFGSDIVFAAAMRLESKLPEGVTILPIIVHDSIMFLVRKDRLQEACKIIGSEMSTPPVPMNVPLVAEFKVGMSWGSMIDLKEYLAQQEVSHGS
jgi:uracil-DNA glycosylase family 4